MLELTKELCALCGVSGDEDAVREAIKAKILPYADDMVEDAAGNLIVFKRGAARGKKVMIAAHMDEVGFIITKITDDGYLKFAPVGGFDTRVLPAHEVIAGKSGVTGIIGIKAVHLASESERENAVKIEDMYIDIGCRSREEAEKRIKPGEYAVLRGDFTEMRGGFVRSKAIDDRFGCALMIEMIQKGVSHDAWFAFTVQEEVGTVGAVTASYRINPEIALVLETTTAADLAGADEDKTVCRAGGGAVIAYRDGGAMYDLELFSRLCIIADKRGIKWQTKNTVAGGTDARSIQISRGGVRIAGISAPVRYIHSAACTANKDDLYAVRDLSAAFLEEVQRDV